MPPQWLTQFTQLSQEKSLLETAYEKVTEEKEMTEEEQEEKDEGDDEMQRDMVCEQTIQRTSAPIDSCRNVTPVIYQACASEEIFNNFRRRRTEYW